MITGTCRHMDISNKQILLERIIPLQTGPSNLVLLSKISTSEWKQSHFRPKSNGCFPCSQFSFAIHWASGVASRRLFLSHDQARLAEGPSLALKCLGEREKKSLQGDSWLSRLVELFILPPDVPFWKCVTPRGEMEQNEWKREKKRKKGEKVRGAGEQCGSRGNVFFKSVEVS